MCGRFTRRYTWKQLHRLYSLNATPASPAELRPSFNLAPRQESPIVRSDKAGRREVVMASWGLVPRWATSPAEGPRPINARSESAAASKMFGLLLKIQRCIVPISGFYEWKAGTRGKTPYYVTRADGEPMHLAGLWEQWEKDGQALTTFTILTTTANEQMSGIHDRMPVILDDEQVDRWLDPALIDSTIIASMMKPCPEGWLDMHSVFRLVNKPDFHDPSCIDRTEEPPAEPDTLF
jgi:putative SOS response-associated peptidase YedK